jgi:hypothetical protein
MPVIVTPTDTLWQMVVVGVYSGNHARSAVAAKTAMPQRYTKCVHMSDAKGKSPIAQHAGHQAVAVPAPDK